MLYGLKYVVKFFILDVKLKKKIESVILLNFIKRMSSKQKLNLIQGSLDELVTMTSLFGMQVTPQKVKEYYDNFRPGITSLDEVRKLIKDGKIYKLEQHGSNVSNFSNDF